MKALCWYGKNDVQVSQVPDPKILNPRDAIIKVTSTAICGSDLHLYNGFIPTMEKGDILGHEFMGEVVELGSAVKNLLQGVNTYSKLHEKYTSWNQFPALPPARYLGANCGIG